MLYRTNFGFEPSELSRLEGNEITPAENTCQGTQTEQSIQDACSCTVGEHSILDSGPEKLKEKTQEKRVPSKSGGAIQKQSQPLKSNKTSKEVSIKLYKLEETASMLRMNRNTLMKYVKEGKIDPVMMRRNVFFTPHEIDRFIEKMKTHYKANRI